jgi:hypothetical protein
MTAGAARRSVRERSPFPRWLYFVWAAFAVAAVALGLHGITGMGGSAADDLLENWVSDLAVWVAAVVCLIGAVRSVRSRTAWLLIGVAIVSWAIGDTLWSLRGDPSAVASVSDVFWLAWYPLVLTGLAFLVRDRVPVFELHRWIDGVVLMLVVITPWFVLFLEPAASHSHASTLDKVLDFAYPLGDAIVVGATIGVMALMAWRPGRMWIALATGFVALAVADAIYSLDALGHTYSSETTFDAIWIAGLAVITYACWLPHPGRIDPPVATGWRAIALPLAAQILAIGLQIYGLFFPVPDSERVFTVIVLLIATVQIVVTRPRARPPTGAERSVVAEVHGPVGVDP